MICAVLFFANIWRQRWALPIIAVIVLGAVSVLLGTAYPAFVQRFRVTPQEFQREQPYIEDNIEGTQRAFDIVPEDIETPPEPGYEPVVTGEDLQANQATKDNIRLWRPSILAQNFLSQQRIRNYYEFRDVDVEPLRARRHAARAHGLRARGDPGADHDVAERASRVHARVRCRGREGERRQQPRALRSSSSPTSRSATSAVRSWISRASTTGKAAPATRRS